MMYRVKWILKRFGYIKRVTFELKDSLIYQKDSRFLLHSYNGHQTPFKSILFYNLFGRVLWASKEYIFKNSIKLEGYETSCQELDLLYKKGDYQILWPKSPMCNSSDYILDDNFSYKIEKSLKLAYRFEKLQFDKTKEWERIAKLIKDYFFDKDSRLIKSRVENFRNNNTLYSKLFNDQFSYIDLNDGYTKSYLQSIDLILEYHRLAKKLDKALLASISESCAGNNLTAQYRGKRITQKLLYHATIVNDILKIVNFDSSRTILDIGAGYGALSRILKYYTPNSTHILLDLPETLILTSYFIKYNFPNAQIALLDDIKDRVDNFDAIIREYDFIIITPSILKYIDDKSIDLVINSASFGFMQKEYLDFYLSQIDRLLKVGGYFYSLNKEYDDKWGIGFYNWDFKTSYITRLFEYNNRFSYAQWLGEKVEK